MVCLKAADCIRLKTACVVRIVWYAAENQLTASPLHEVINQVGIIQAYLLYRPYIASGVHTWEPCPNTA